MTWMLIVALVWVFLSLPVALVVGRGLRMADQRAEAARRLPNVPDFIPADVVSSVRAAGGRRAA